MVVQFIHEDELGIFSSHFNDGPDLWIKPADRSGLGYDLIHIGSAQKFGSQLATGPCETQLTKLFRFVFLLQPIQIT